MFKKWSYFIQNNFQKIHIQKQLNSNSLPEQLLDISKECVITLSAES